MSTPDTVVRAENEMLGQLLDDMMAQRKELMDDMLAEKKRDRRHKNIRFGIIVTGVLLTVLTYMAMIAAVGGGVGGTAPSGPYAAVVQLKGPIADSEPANAVALSKALGRAFKDPRAAGVVVYVNSPGGSPVQSAIVYDRIKSLKAEYPDTKIVTVATDSVTSGAYFIAAATDKIFVNRSTITGSIGVISDGFGFAGVMDRLGIERRVFTAGKNKARLDSFSPLGDGDSEKISEILAQIHTHFIDAVTDGRGARLVMDTEGLFDGDVWTGGQAVKIGLADGLGDLTGVLEAEFGVEYARDYSIKPTLAERLMRLAASSAFDEISSHSALSLR